MPVGMCVCVYERERERERDDRQARKHYLLQQANEHNTREIQMDA